MPVNAIILPTDVKPHKNQTKNNVAFISTKWKSRAKKTDEKLLG
jgi:hypothetical protein